MKGKLSFLPYCAVYPSETLLKQEQMWAGLDCVCGELIGWLWFAIGGSHVSDRLPRPRHHGREEMKSKGELF